MSYERQLREAVQQLAGTHLKDVVKFVDCNVNSVNINAGTAEVTPIGGNATTDIINVNLESEVADGLLIIPVIGSTVTVLYSTRNNPYIIKYSDIQTIYYSGNLWQFGDGTFGGMVKLLDPSNPNSGVLARLNNLENLINSLISLYNTHTHASNGTPTTNLETSTAAVTTRAELENTEVTHGN